MMDDKFERLAVIAREAGCEEYVRAEHRKAQEIMARSSLNLAVAGRANAGKSTLINRMTASDILEESTLPDEDPRPIRICFTRTPDDERCRCVNVLNGEWNERGVTIYELHGQNLDDPAEMDNKDFVVYVVSATTPFSAEDIAALKRIAGFPRQAVMAGMEFVPGERREKIINYSAKINDSLGMPPIIMFENSAAQDIRTSPSVWHAHADVSRNTWRRPEE